LVAGCYEGVDGFGGDIEERGKEINGVELNGLKFNGLKFNGIKFNGLKFNGIKLNGIKFNGIKLNGIKLNGLKLNGLKLNGSEFTAAVDEGGEVTERSGAELIGMVFDITAEVEGEEVPLELMVEDMYPDAEAEFDDVFLYEIRVRVAGDDEWVNPCVDNDDIGVPAIPLQNYWDFETGDRIDDADVISWSCTTGVLAHCVQWGYRPWAEAEDCKKSGKWGKWGKWGKKGKQCKDVGLGDYHQACTRMARADYCGNGEAWTVPGTVIDIWDNLDPQIQSREANWAIEAEWTPDGAYCLNDIRQQEWKEEGLYPVCGDSAKDQKRWQKRMDRRSKRCGSLRNRDSLLVSSFNDAEDYED
jgi:hypothetical protein